MTFLKSLKRQDSGLANLVTICTISLILSIGYVINFQAIVKVIRNENPEFEAWALIYAASTCWLFLICLFIIIITLFGVKIALLSTKTHRIIICILFFIGASGYIICFLVGLFNKNSTDFDEYVHWQYDCLIYVLSPLYLSCLIFFFGDNRFRQVIRLILFSLMLFITPFLSLISLIIQNKNNLSNLPNSELSLISAYASICIATSILITFHIICIYNYYNSGLFIKFLIIISLAYSVAVLIYGQRGDYYYYCLLVGLYIIYSFEIFVPAQKQRVHINIKDIVNRPSYDPSIEKQMSEMISVSDNKGILQFAQKKNKNIIVEESNPNENIPSVIKIFPDFIPCKENANKYFNELLIDDGNSIDRLSDSIVAIVPFYNETANEIHATLRTLHYNFEYIKKKNPIYKFTHFNVLLIGDGWFKAAPSTQKYLTQLYNIKCDENDNNFDNVFGNYEKQDHNTVILQTKHGKKLCINPFKNNDEKLYLKVTTIIKIDNRKKANSHEWFMGKYGFAEWCAAEYMFFTDAYSTTSEESLYRCMMHMKQPTNKDVVCCTGRARVYTTQQELEFQHFMREDLKTEQDEEEKEEEEKYNDIKWWQNDIFKPEDETAIEIYLNQIDGDSHAFYELDNTKYANCLTVESHLRSCQMFEFEALYGTIGCYLLGGFLPVIPGPCGFYRSKYLLADKVRGWYFDKIKTNNDSLILGNMKLAEDRLLTVSSILNCEESVRHSLISECVFYFDPITSLTQLMKQRRRWLNGSIATVIFLLFKVSFSTWNTNIFRKFYVVVNFWMQLIMYIMIALSPAIIFVIAYQLSLNTILHLLISNNETAIDAIIYLFVALSWTTFLLFIYFMQRGSDLKIKCITIKKTLIVNVTLFISFTFAVLIMAGTILQLIDFFGGEPVWKEQDDVTKWFGILVIVVQIVFLVQSFILSPIVAKDFKTFIILAKTFWTYFIYAPFYVTYFFINAISNIHDLSWGTRPDDEMVENDNNPKRTTFKVLIVVIFCNIVLAVLIVPLTQSLYTFIGLWVFLAFPSLYPLFFGIIWLISERLKELWSACKPKRLKDEIQYEA